MIFRDFFDEINAGNKPFPLDTIETNYLNTFQGFESIKTSIPTLKKFISENIIGYFDKQITEVSFYKDYHSYNHLFTSKISRFGKTSFLLKFYRNKPKVKIYSLTYFLDYEGDQSSNFTEMYLANGLNEMKKFISENKTELKRILLSNKEIIVQQIFSTDSELSFIDRLK